MHLLWGFVLAAAGLSPWSCAAPHSVHFFWKLQRRDMEKQSRLYLLFAALSLATGIVMTTIDLRQANHITHFTMLGYILATLYVALFFTNTRGLFKATFYLGCTLVFILLFYEILLFLKADSLGLRVFRILFGFLFYYCIWSLFLRTPWNNMRCKTHNKGLQIDAAAHRD